MAPPVTGDDDDVQPLPSGISTFVGTDSSIPPDDLAPLDALIGNARYIGIGESVHTSGGYYAFKRRMIEHLVRDLGVRVVTFETPRTAAKRLDSFVQTCQGTAFDALNGSIFGVFVDDNTEALVQFLCEFNKTHAADPVRIFGFDAQQPQDDTPELNAFLTRAAAADAAGLATGIAMCETAPADAQHPFTQAAFDACTAGLDAIDAYIVAHRPALVTATDETSVRLGEVAALSLRSWQVEDFTTTSDPNRSFEARDVAMHHIFDALRDVFFADRRAIIWAHNYHLMTDHPDVVGDPVPGVRTFGTELRDEVGADYLPIALTGFDVQINWPGVGTGPVSPAIAGSFVLSLHSLAKPYLIVDPAAPFAGTVTRPLRDGASFGDGTLVPSAHYGALVYLEHSPEMNALFW